MDVDRMLGRLLGGGAASFAGGALAGGAAGALLSGKSGRKVGGKLLKYGALAAVAGLAYAAWRNHQARSSSSSTASQSVPPPSEPAPPPRDPAFLPPPSDASGRERLGLTLVRAMVAAARADGRIDDAENELVFRKVDELGLDADERALLLDALRRPPDIDALVRSASSPEVALEIYAAARMAVDPDTAAERAWLQLLAARLGLDDGLVAELEQRLAAV